MKGGRRFPIDANIRIGTRGSALAMTQTRWVADILKRRIPETEVEIQVIKTKGDIMQDVSLVKIGGKGVFVREIEEALLRGEIDMAVHSMKDVPAELPEGLTIGVIPEREDPRDVLIGRDRIKMEAMPRGARIGTGSLRRGIQVRSLLPDVQIVPLRGNLDTRIRKIESEGLDGVIVAAAGIRRMGWVQRVSQFIPVELMLPAVGQGALGIEMRMEDGKMAEALSFLNHPATWIEVGAERALNFEKIDKKFIVEIWHTSQIIGMFFKVIPVNEYTEDIKWDNKQNESTIIKFITKLGSEKIADQLFVQKDIRGFEKEFFYIFKPNEKRLWHKAIGYLDVNEFADAILKAGRNSL